MIFELIKTSVGLVSKSTADGVAEWAKDIAEQSKTEITLLEAVDVILNLASKTNDAWIDTGLGFKYLEFDTTYDYYTVFNWVDGTEIEFTCGDETVIYNIKNKKYYKRYIKMDEI
mgnify:CR=1 FL=1